MLVYSFMNIFSTDAPRPAWECNILYPLLSSSCILQSIFCVGEKKHKHLIRHCFCLLCDHSARENENLNSVHCSNEQKGFCNMHMDKLCNKCHFSWVVYCYEQCFCKFVFTYWCKCVCSGAFSAFTSTNIHRGEIWCWSNSIEYTNEIKFWLCSIINNLPGIIWRTFGQVV